MNHNTPINFPNGSEFSKKWLAMWNDDLANLSKINKECDGYVGKVKNLQPAERRRLLTDLIKYIDLTILNNDDNKQRVYDLVDKAVLPLKSDPNLHCGGICVYPARVVDAVERLASKGPSQKIPVVAAAGGFPSGQFRLETKLLEVQLALADGAKGIDIVINRADALANQWKFIHHEVAMMRMACAGKAHFKTILSTGELVDMKRIYIASMVAMMAGSDFIKTSTGKETVNATLQASYVMCQAILHYCKTTGVKVGFKAAGGIRTADEALSYVLLAEDILGKEWFTADLFRIGASTLLDNIVNELQSP